MGWGHHAWDFGELGGWQMVFGGLMMLLVWGGLLAGLFFVIRAAVGGRRDEKDLDPGGRALRILSERYAQGEISADEYREMRGVLEN